MPLLGNRANQIRVAGTGHIYVAPVGTVAPTDTAAAWSATWQDLGYTDETGVTYSKKDSFDPVGLWQSTIPGRMLAKSRDLQFKFNLTQLNSVTLPLWGGGNAVGAGTGIGEYIFDVSPNFTPYERALGIEWTDTNSGTIIYRYICARAQVTDTSDQLLTRTKNLALQITMMGLAVDDNTPVVRMIMKDPNMV